MNKIILAFALAIMVSGFSFGQNEKKYAKLIDQSWILYQTGDYLKSARKYTKAFSMNKKHVEIKDLYNAARCWALAKQPDSSFSLLFKMVSPGNFTDIKKILADNELKSLHEDPRWKVLISSIEKNIAEAQARLDLELIAALDTIYRDDQKYREQMEVTSGKNMNSDELLNLSALLHQSDSINQIKVTRILDERGWPGPDIVGEQGVLTIFMVIQHADITTQVKYLPLLRDAVTNGKLSPASFAMLEDRIALRLGKKQIYGTQIGINLETGGLYLKTLDDPRNVDKRRSLVGLGKLADYLAVFGMTWNTRDYIRALPEIEAFEKKSKQEVPPSVN